MKASGNSLLRLDACFYLPHRLVEWIFVRRSLPPSTSDQLVILKLMGMGSLVQFASICDEFSVDKSKVVLITFERHRSVCKLMGFERAWYIRTTSPLLFIIDCLIILRRTATLKPHTVIDYERCSHAVATFSTLLAWSGAAFYISFESGRSLKTQQRTVHAVQHLRQRELLLLGLERIPRKKSQEQTGPVRIEVNNIIININASPYLLARRYPLAYFENVITSLHAWRPSLQFFLTGSSEEKSYVDSLIRRMPNLPLRNMAGTWSLEVLIQQLQQCALFITGDSGPLHLAAQLRIPTVVLWGPTQPEHFGYEHHPDLIHATRSLSCSPCLTHPHSTPTRTCHGRIDCFRKLSPDSVVEKCIAQLNNTPSVRSSRLNPAKPPESHPILRQSFTP